MVVLHQVFKHRLALVGDKFQTHEIGHGFYNRNLFALQCKVHSSLAANLTATNNNHRFTNRFKPFQRIDSGNALGMIDSGNATRH